MPKRFFLYTIIVTMAALLALEGAARLVEAYALSARTASTENPGWQTEFFGSLFDWHESDPDLLWRFKANLSNPLIMTNSEHILGEEISRAKAPGSYRVLIIGDSSPVGLGLASRRQTFAEILRFLLDRYHAGRKNVEVLNAAVSGYSSEQVSRFLALKGWVYDPDVVVVYCGNNDASISGPISDRQLLEAQRLKTMRSVLSRMALYRVLRTILASRGGPAYQSKDSLTVRVSPERFETNLRAIIGQCRQHDCPVIFLKPPVPYLWPAGLQFKPFLHVTGKDGRVLLPQAVADFLGRNVQYCLDTALIHKLYAQSDVFTRAVYSSAYTGIDDPGKAMVEYQAVAARDSTDPVVLNNLGVAYWGSGRHQAADSAFRAARRAFATRYGGVRTPLASAAASPFFFNTGINLLAADSARSGRWYDTTSMAFIYLDSALQSDYFSLRIKRAYWGKIDALKGAPGVAVIDLPGLFQRKGGEGLFIDHCHPTAQGHILIARQIYDTILARDW